MGVEFPNTPKRVESYPPLKNLSEPLLPREALKEKFILEVAELETPEPRGMFSNFVAKAKAFLGLSKLDRAIQTALLYAPEKATTRPNPAQIIQEARLTKEVKRLEAEVSRLENEIAGAPNQMEARLKQLQEWTKQRGGDPTLFDKEDLDALGEIGPSDISEKEGLLEAARQRLSHAQRKLDNYHHDIYFRERH